MASTDLVLGEDGCWRCPWGNAPSDYRAYHDDEWGRPVHGDQPLFERLTLESFQSGLSWLTILRKRENFRRAFDGFAIDRVAGYDESDVARLMEDPGIVRNRAKIEAAIANARVVVQWQADEGPGVLDRTIWTHVPSDAPAPRGLSDVTQTSPASVSLARTLKQRGWRFLGPTTAHAALQAVGVINDHLEGCHARGASRRDDGG